MTNKRPSALITGASSGIGRCYALAIASRANLNILLSARSEKRLSETALACKREFKNRGLDETDSPQISIFPADLAKAPERAALVEKVRKTLSPVELLINCAGHGSFGPHQENLLGEELSIVAVNCLAPLELSHALLAQMKANGRGSIINVSSTTAFQAIPYMAVYGASKAFIMSYSMALHEEAKRHGIKVLTHCPGPTETNFHLSAGLDSKLDFIPAQYPEKVVREALKALDDGRSVLINGKLNRLLVQLLRVLPRSLPPRIVANKLSSIRRRRD